MHLNIRPLCVALVACTLLIAAGCGSSDTTSNATPDILTSASSEDAVSIDEQDTEETENEGSQDVETARSEESDTGPSADDTQACVPNCEGACGDDGCGGSCGSCRR